MRPRVLPEFEQPNYIRPVDYGNLEHSTTRTSAHGRQRLRNDNHGNTCGRDDRDTDHKRDLQPSRRASSLREPEVQLSIFCYFLKSLVTVPRVRVKANPNEGPVAHSVDVDVAKSLATGLKHFRKEDS